MGNAPLHSPPPATARRVVHVVTTDHRFGTSLTLLESKTSAENRVLPFSFEGGQISADEYHQKMDLLRSLLSEWKGGFYTLAFVGYSILLLIAFIAAYLTPAFWTSPFFAHPGYLFVVIGFQLLLLLWIARTVKKQNEMLQEDVEDLFRAWRGCGIRVSMKRVMTIGKDHELLRRREKGQAPSGYNCFCIIMDVNNNQHGDEEQDARSVATALTDVDD